MTGYARNLGCAALVLASGFGMAAHSAASGPVLTDVSLVAATAAPTSTQTAEPGPSSSPDSSPTATPTATISPTPPPPLHSAVTTLRLPSRDHGRTSRAVVVYRPAVPDSSRLPVVYLLHGQYGTPSGLVNSRLQSALDAVFARGVAPFVVAAPDGASTVRTDDEWADASDGADRLETFLQQQVISAVEGSHPRDRAHRAVAGFSMGGYAAAFTAGRQNTTYGQVVSMAGYFHVDDPQHVFTDPAYRDLHYPLHHLRWLTSTRVLLLDCNRETDPVIAGEARRMHDALAAIGRPPGLRFTDGDHDGEWVLRQWPGVAQFLAQGWGR